MRSYPAAFGHLLLSAVLGLGFFALPVRVGGQWTVFFDVVVKAITGTAGDLMGWFCVALMALGVYMPFSRDYRFEAFRGNQWLFALRCVGLLLGVVFIYGQGIVHLGPFSYYYFEASPLIWRKLAYSVAVIIPIGAAILLLLVEYGFLELVGTFMRPIMRPLFRLPGRAALDDLMSWLGSYSVGLYLTRNLVVTGKYTRREGFIIVTGFSTVSIGFVGVVASTLDLLHLFPVIFGTYFVLVYLLAALQARTWPATSIPDEALHTHDPEPEDLPDGVVITAWARAIQRAHDAPPIYEVLHRGFMDGIFLTASILGTIVSVGTLALVIAKATPLFTWLGTPLVPVLTFLGLPDAAMLAPATVAGITEMYIPAVLAKDAAIEGRFFICVLSISQLIFFSSVGPMMLEMFYDVPVKVGHLLFLFALRTALLIPALAAITWLFGQIGVFG